MPSLSIIVASRSRSVAERLAVWLTSHPEFRVKLRVISNGHTDPLHGVPEPPDLLLLHYGESNLELQHLAELGAEGQVPLIVCGPANDTEAMRLAMRAGARDYLPEDVAESDLIAALTRFREETARNRAREAGKLIAVVNGKGGSGASFVATNLAHSLVVDSGLTTLLMDLDLQFGGLCRYLDIVPKMGLLDALETVYEMDEVSAKAYITAHSSGLKLMAAPSSRLTLAGDVALDRIDALLKLYLGMNRYVVADVPARIDPVTEHIFEQSDDIVLVVQQSLPSVQDGTRLLRLLTKTLGIAGDRIAVVVNRFSRNAAVEMADIKKAMHIDDVYSIPNNYKLVSESVNTGIPVAELSRSSPVSKSIRSLQRFLTGQPEDRDEQGILKRAFPNFLKGVN